MTENGEGRGPSELRATARILVSYLKRNRLPAEKLPELISSVAASLKPADDRSQFSQTPALNPAVPIKRSIEPDYIVCLEDGRKFKSIRRHIQEKYGLTPVEYRRKWGLPPDYPMVAPNYSQRRAEIARILRAKRLGAEGDEPFRGACVRDILVARLGH